MKPFTATELKSIRSELSRSKRGRHLNVAKTLGCETSQELYDRLYLTGYKISNQQLSLLGHSREVLTFDTILRSKSPVHFSQKRYDESLKTAIQQL